TLLPDAGPIARPLFARRTNLEKLITRSTSSWLFSARLTVASVDHLFFRRPNKVSRSRLVERRKHVARAHLSAVQCSAAQSDHRRAGVPAAGWHRGLYFGDRLPAFYLAPKHATDLVFQHTCNARGNRNYDGPVPVCADHDHSKYGGLRPAASL